MSGTSCVNRVKPGAVARFLAAALALASLAACRDAVAPPPDPVAPPDTVAPHPEPNPIIIGGSRSATGGLRTEGLNMARGFELAVKMLNEDGGIGGREVQLVLHDDESSPRRAAEIYLELATDDSVDLLIGPYASSITSAVVPVAEAARRPLVTPLAASHSIWGGLSRQWSVQVMNNARDNLGGAVVVGARMGAETVALVYENSAFPVSAAEGVRATAAEHGLEMVMDEIFPVGGADHAGLVAQAQAAGADLLLGGGYTEDALAFVGAVAEAGYKPLLSSWTIGPSEPGFPELVGIDPARCVLGNAPWTAGLGTSGPLATNATFVERYVAEYGSEPGYTAAAGFGAIELLAEAARASVDADGEVDETAVRNHLFSTTTETVLGPYGVTPLGEPDAGSQQQLVRLQIQWQDDGQGGLAQRIVYPDGVAEAEPCTTRPEPIVVGATMSLTGALGEDGTLAARGYELAVDMLNEMGGIDGRRVRLVLVDDESDTAKAARIYTQFVQSDSVDALLGPYSSTVTNAVVPVAEEAAWPFIASFAAASDIWLGRGREWSVQTWSSGRNFLKGAVQLAADSGLSKVALVHYDAQFPGAMAEGVRDAVKEHGMKLVLDRSFSDQADYEVLAAAARDAGGELFIGGGYIPHATELTKAAGAIGYTPRLMSWGLGAPELDFPERVGSLARCVVGYTGWWPTLSVSGALADNATFIARHEEAYGVPPGQYAAASFGAVELLVEALRSSVSSVGGIDHAAVRDHLFSTTTQTVFGDYSVAPLGDPDAGLQRATKGLLVQWQDDDQKHLVLKVVHPAAEAEASVCLAG